MASLIDTYLDRADNEIMAAESLKNINHEESHQRNVIELRENFQYGTETSIEDETLSKLKGLCKKALEEAKNIIY